MGRLHLTTGEATADADVFQLVMSDMEADVCDYQPRTGVSTNSRPIFSRTGNSHLTIQKAVTRSPERAELDVKASVSKFTVEISDDLLVSMNGIVSSITSNRQAALTEIGGGTMVAAAAVAAAAAESLQLDREASTRDDGSSQDMALLIEFEGLDVELVKATQKLACLQLDTMSVRLRQRESGSLKFDLGVGALTMTDRCSPSKDSLRAIVSSNTNLASAAAESAIVDLLTLCVEKDETVMRVVVALQPLTIVYNPYLTERLPMSDMTS